MKRIIVTLSLLLLFSASPSPAAEADRIAVLLNDPTFKALDQPLRTYIADVESRFPVKLEVVARDWKTPEEVRARAGNNVRHSVVDTPGQPLLDSPPSRSLLL